MRIEDHHVAYFQLDGVDFAETILQVRLRNVIAIYAVIVASFEFAPILEKNISESARAEWRKVELLSDMLSSY